MAGGTFKLSQPKVRPGTYVNVKNGRQPTASGTTRGTAVIPLIGYDWGPRGKWIVLSSESPDGHIAELGRSIYDDSNSAMIMLQLMLLGASIVYVYIPDAGDKAKKEITVESATLTATAKYNKGTREIRSRSCLWPILQPVLMYRVHPGRIRGGAVQRGNQYR